MIIITIQKILIYQVTKWKVKLNRDEMDKLTRVYQETGLDQNKTK